MNLKTRNTSTSELHSALALSVLALALTLLRPQTSPKSEILPWRSVDRPERSAQLLTSNLGTLVRSGNQELLLHSLRDLRSFTARP